MQNLYFAIILTATKDGIQHTISNKFISCPITLVATTSWRIKLGPMGFRQRRNSNLNINITNQMKSNEFI